MYLDETLQALADPTRRDILAYLANGESRVTEVAQRFPISLNSVSKHIRTLERAGLVKRRVSGRDHFLSLDVEPLGQAADWLNEHRRLWAWRLKALEKILKEQGDG